MSKFRLIVKAQKDVAYLLHLDPPYKQARHYLGSTDDLRVRLPQHGTPEGSKLLQAQREAGGSWHLVRTWKGGRRKESQLKSNAGTRYCPECTEHPYPGTNTVPRVRRTRRQREAAQLERQQNDKEEGMNNNGERDYEEEAYNRRILETGDGEKSDRQPKVAPWDEPAPPGMISGVEADAREWGVTRDQAQAIRDKQDAVMRDPEPGSNEWHYQTGNYVDPEPDWDAGPPYVSQYDGRTYTDLERTEAGG